MESKELYAEIGFLAQFIDVLEVLEKYSTIEEVKADIVIRKKLYKDEINRMRKYCEKS